MSMLQCVARAAAMGFQPVENGSPDLPQGRTELRSPCEHPTPDDAHTSHCSASPTSPVSIIPCKGDASPISTLIEELLVIIFDDVITSESLSCQCRRKRTGWWLSSPRSLASVSRTWRDIVFACPKLWRYVHLTPVQSVHALQEHLRLSSPFPIHLTVHQWPFQNPIPTSGPFSVVALTVQLQSVLFPAEKDGITLAPASARVASISINATESSTFLNFVLQTWTGRGSKFPALRRVTMNGNVRAMWSRACFFDGRHAPSLDRLELSNVATAHEAHRLPWGIGSNLTTLVWTAPAHKNGSLVIAVSSFHHILSSFPNLTTLELHEHVVALEFATLDSLDESGITPITTVRHLRLTGQVFLNAVSAYMLFYLLPSLRDVAVRGRACSGPLGVRTVTHALQALICLPKLFVWPTVLPNLEDLELECVDGSASACEQWKNWCMGELELWKQWREAVANAGEESPIARVRMHMEVEGEAVPMDKRDV